jgi:aerobic-type carbon monoxide dehydrogenase small subunit (CoxS/CutS family)
MPNLREVDHFRVVYFPNLQFWLQIDCGHHIEASLDTDLFLPDNPPIASRRVTMAADLKIKVNEQNWTVAAAADTPLLYVLTNEMNLQGPRFGCGLGQCGSCSVLVNGVETRSCMTPVSNVAGKTITTLEGLPAWYAAQKKLAAAPVLHPVQQAMIDEQAVQCGYCFNGMIIKASELLSKTPRPSETQIRSAMNGHLCRCGSYPRILKAVNRASQAMNGGAK